VIKKAPLSIAILFFLLLCLIIPFIFKAMEWRYGGVVDNLREQVKTHEMKMSFMSFDDEVRKMEEARFLLEERIAKFQKEIIKMSANDLSWLEPICASAKDNMNKETMLQILVHNELGQELGLKNFNKDFCKNKYDKK
jgi:hypothetical protein